MPRAVADLQATEKHDLKTCPGGYVVLRRMSYGQKLQRQTMATEASVRGEGKKQEMSLQMMQQRVTAYEFAHCIADHNLDDERDQKLNFTNEVDVFRLDPRTGEEIAELISSMNNFEDSDEAKNSKAGSELVLS
jgi:hypothetical protein